MPIKVGILDVGEPVVPIYVDAHYHFTYLLLTWGYCPITLVKLSNDHPHLISRERLVRTLTDAAGWNLWVMSLNSRLDDFRKAEHMGPPISVIICSHGNEYLLDRCLSSTENLDYGAYEVLVVDDSAHRTGLAKITDKYGVRLANEEGIGIGNLRNCGIAESSHDLIAFVDADCLVTAGWLRGIASAFNDSAEVMAVTGMVMPSELETSAQIDFEFRGFMNKGVEPFSARWDSLASLRKYSPTDWGTGANMAFRRAVFEKIGQFKPRLAEGRTGGLLSDMDFLFRVVSSGYTLRYEPAALVQHLHLRSSEAVASWAEEYANTQLTYVASMARLHPEMRKEIYSSIDRERSNSGAIRQLWSRDKTERSWAKARIRDRFSIRSVSSQTGKTIALQGNQTA